MKKGYDGNNKQEAATRAEKIAWVYVRYSLKVVSRVSQGQGATKFSVRQ